MSLYDKYTMPGDPWKVHVTYEMNLDRFCLSYSKAFPPFFVTNSLIPCHQSTGKNHRTGSMRYYLSCTRNTPYLINNKKLFRVGSSKRYWFSHSVLLIEISICKHRNVYQCQRRTQHRRAGRAPRCFWIVFVICDCITRIYFNCTQPSDSV